MNIEPQQLLQQALSLPETDRAAIAASLFQSLDPGIDADADAAWAAETERRIASIDDGEVTLLPWPDEMQEMRDRRNG